MPCWGDLTRLADLTLVCASSHHSQRQACGFSILWTLDLLPRFVDEETKVQRGLLSHSPDLKSLSIPAVPSHCHKPRASAWRSDYPLYILSS